MLEYNQNKILRSRQLRQNMTPCEEKLWHLYLKKYPLKFQRQKIIGDYIADFYCAKEHLIIEVDGESHDSIQNIIHDKLRTKIIAKYHLRILRIPNEKIRNHFYEVCEYIDMVVQAEIDSRT